MAMNFFERQRKAKRNTKMLVLLFVAAVLAIILALDALIMGLLYYNTGGNALVSTSPWEWLNQQWGTLGAVSAGGAALIGGGTFYRMASLRAGGSKVALQMGGSPVSVETQDPAMRQLRNVVEEIAIASGVPVPQIFVLSEETGINAFAAGYANGDAAIAVSQGCLKHLSRDELQGVVAHEFSHILNGDMRLNIRLMGILFGILMLGVIGRRMLMSTRYTRSSRDSKGAGSIVMIGLAVMVIGYIGVFFGNLIKAAVSRQREYLADSAAVQFTRNPEGIAGALKKIAVLQKGSKLDTPNTEEVSHMLFASGLNSLFATHPPLMDRIKAIEPRFTETQLRVLRQQMQKDAQREQDKLQREREREQQKQQQQEKREKVFTTTATAAVVLSADKITSSVGNPGWDHVDYARKMRDGLPEAVKVALMRPNTALAAICGLLISPVTDVQQRQLAMLKEAIGQHCVDLMINIAPYLKQITPLQRLPLVELAVPGIRAHLDAPIIPDLLQNMIQADNHIDLFEYALFKVLMQGLEDRRKAPAETRKLRRCEQQVQVVLSLMAQHGVKDEEEARRAYAAGLHVALPQAQLPYAPVQEVTSTLDEALDDLSEVESMGKEALMKALVTTLLHDGKVKLAEVELLRAVCAVLECPLPPVLQHDD